MNNSNKKQQPDNPGPLSQPQHIPETADELEVAFWAWTTANHDVSAGDIIAEAVLRYNAIYLLVQTAIWADSPNQPVPVLGDNTATSQTLVL